MKLDFYDVVSPILFGMMAIFFLFIGLRGILTKRPFLISQRWFLSLMCAIFIPIILLQFSLPFPGDFSIMGWLQPLLFGIILLMMCYQMRGYMAYAVTDTSFREALVRALEKLQLPYEESLSLIRLTSIEADLQVSVQGWMGTGLIKVKQRAHRAALREIVKTMNEHFRMSVVSTNMISCVFSVVIGGFMVIYVVSMLFGRSIF